MRRITSALTPLTQRTTGSTGSTGSATAALRADATPASASVAHYGPRGTIAVLNVYDSDFEWPDDTKITALRLIQVLPKTTPPADKPRIGIGTETNARAVLGDVPVEPDGSAHFEAPVGKVLYFQALDEQGMAVQSMRSGTYLHPGELSRVGRASTPAGRSA